MEFQTFHWIILLGLTFLLPAKHSASRLPAKDVNICPPEYQWQVRAVEFCYDIHNKDPSLYHCLHTQVGGYKEICADAIEIDQGFFPMWSEVQGVIYAEKCTYGTYQEAQLLLSNELNECQNKSKCQKNGQVSSFCPEGGIIADRQCRCNYKKGFVAYLYAVVNPLNESCFKPKEKDDRCLFLNDCSEEMELNPAYRCVSKCPIGYHRPEMKFDCEEINSVSSTSETPSKSTTQRQSTTVSQKKPKSESGFGMNSRSLAIGLGLGVVVLIILIFVVFVLIAKRNGGEFNCHCNICSETGNHIHTDNFQVGTNNQVETNVVVEYERETTNPAANENNGVRTRLLDDPSPDSMTESLEDTSEPVHDVTELQLTDQPTGQDIAIATVHNEPDNDRKAREKHYHIPVMLKDHLYHCADGTESESLGNFKLSAKGKGLPSRIVDDRQSNVADIFKSLEDKNLIGVGNYKELFDMIKDQDTESALQLIVDEITKLLENGNTFAESNV